MQRQRASRTCHDAERAAPRRGADALASFERSGLSITLVTAAYGAHAMALSSAGEDDVVCAAQVPAGSGPAQQRDGRAP